MDSDLAVEKTGSYHLYQVIKLTLPRVGRNKHNRPFGMMH
jgi:hypothetical protein